jgi:CBS domain containing-hemolysin-like protein
MIGISLGYLACLMVLSALFSSAETAFTSLSPGQLNAMAVERGKRGRQVKNLTDRPDILLTTLLIGNNLANLGASAIVTATTIRLFGNSYVAAATGILTMTVLVFCEVTPKQIAMETNERICLNMALPIWFLSYLFRPLIWIISSISRTITMLFAGGKKRSLSLEYLLHHVSAAEMQGVVESYEEEMVRKVFRINDTPVEAIMTHRIGLFTVDEEITVSDALDRFLESGHSRAPVLKGDRQHVSGIITVPELIRALRADPESLVKDHITPPYLVPGTMKAHELFFRLKKEPIDIAVVLDEYGGLDGVVTREDVMEEIFGELYDDKDVPEDPIRKLEGGEWLIRGDADFYDVSDTLGLKLEHDSRTHTVGGYLMEQLEYIPAAGTVIDLKEGSYTILEIRDKRIITVRFRPSGGDDR